MKNKHQDDVDYLSTPFLVVITFRESNEQEQSDFNSTHIIYDYISRHEENSAR